MGWFRRDQSETYAQALLKVSVNMFEVATESGRRDHAPLVLKFERPDAKLRYMAFCLATTYYFAVDENTLTLLEKALQKAWDHVGGMALTAEGASLFSGPVNKPSTVQDAGTDLGRTVQAWKGYASHFATRKAAGKSMERDETSARIVCTMLRHVESTAVMTDDDARRLMPLARWLEETTSVLAASVNSLAR
jgi:hypothetical protein